MIINLCLFLLIAFLIALPWYIKVTKTFGMPFYNPHQEGISKTMEWFKFINARPWYTFAVQIPYLVPVYVLGYLVILAVLLRKDRGRNDLFLTIWFLSFLVILTYTTLKNEMLGPDDRYMLPAYPAIAILASGYFDKLRIFLNKKWGFSTGNFLSLLILGLCVSWSLKIAFHFVPVSNVISVPF